MKIYQVSSSTHLVDTRGTVGRSVLVALVAWTLAWKGASLWRAAKDDSRSWFVTLLISNTLGVLDAIYLFGVSGARRRAERSEASIRASTGEPEQLGHRQET
ncbi:hypothetical protein SAMN05216219_1122 [Mycetocola miduiensis]|uniref:DUF5652 domain-containing protein n=1 Tax=Mycetocola miduiensis TaxID=995034 RepID=A0A1I4ZWH8_9MICO|nr:hypothetical protein SAMN05216219_1122 [Mycetocola miduiensis]